MILSLVSASSKPKYFQSIHLFNKLNWYKSCNKVMTTLSLLFLLLLPMESFIQTHFPVLDARYTAGTLTSQRKRNRVNVTCQYHAACNYVPVHLMEKKEKKVSKRWKSKKWNKSSTYINTCDFSLAMCYAILGLRLGGLTFLMRHWGGGRGDFSKKWKYLHTPTNIFKLFLDSK